MSNRAGDYYTKHETQSGDFRSIEHHENESAASRWARSSSRGGMRVTVFHDSGSGYDVPDEVWEDGKLKKGNPGIPAHAPGISFVIGIYGHGSTRTSKVQSILFDSQWSQGKAKGWLKEHGFKYGQTDDVAGNMLRFRQEDPGEFEEFRTIKPDRRRSNRRNPDSDSADMYESFHGTPSTGVEEFTETEHFHGNLAELGELVEMVVVTVNGDKVKLGFETGKENGKSKSNPFWPFSSFHKTTVYHIPTGKKYGLVGKEHGYEIYKRQGYKGESEYVVPKLDRESYFESLKEAKRFVRSPQQANPKGRHRHSPGPISTALSSASSLVRPLTHRGPLADLKSTGGKVLGYLDSQLDRAVGNPGYMRAWPKAKAKGPFTVTVGSETKQLSTIAEVKRLLKSKKSSPATLGEFFEVRGVDGGVVSSGRVWKGYLTYLGGRKMNPADTGPVLLCSNEAGTQLYLQGGDQSLKLSYLNIPERDSVVIGDVHSIVYHTAKRFGKKDEEYDYDHKFSEDSKGPLPVLRYDNLNQKMYIDGGSYHIPKPFAGTSQGITD